MKLPKPKARAAQPKRVDAIDVQDRLATAKASGQPMTTMLTYLDQHAPVPLLDTWGQPLPLSLTEQDRLNRMCAVLFDPLARGRELLASGSLDTQECDALRNGSPDAYEYIRQHATDEMVAAGPPLPQWSDAVLGILFGRDACLVYGAAQNDSSAQPSRGSNFSGKPPGATPADVASEPNLAKGR